MYLLLHWLGVYFGCCLLALSGLGLVWLACLRVCCLGMFGFGLFVIR